MSGRSVDRDQVGDIYPASRIDLESLWRFVIVAEEANFTRAAARLHLVQSAISATIKNLEHERGAPLLNRNSKRVLLTDAGPALLPGARAALDARAGLTQHYLRQLTVPTLWRGEVQVVPGAGHALQQEAPQQLAALLTSFIGDLDRWPGPEATA